MMMNTATERIRINSAHVTGGSDGDGMYRVRAGRKGRTYRVLPPIPPAPEAICRIRERSGLSRAEFADALGVSASTVTAWENGRRMPGGVACRLLDMMDRDESLIDRYIG